MLSFPPPPLPRLIKGAFFGLLFGFIIGVIRFILEFGFREPPCGSELSDDRPEWIKAAVGNVNFLHFSPISLVLTAVVAFAVSLVTKPIREDQLYRLTFWSRFRTERRRPIDGDEDKPIVEKKEGGEQQPKYIGLLHKLCCVKQPESAEEGGGDGEAKRGPRDEDEVIRKAVETIQESKNFKM